LAFVIRVVGNEEYLAEEDSWEQIVAMDLFLSIKLNF